MRRERFHISRRPVEGKEIKTGFWNKTFLEDL